MSPSPVVGGGRVAQVIRETLDGLAARDLRDQVLTQALYVAQLDEVPEGGEAVRKFVEVHLREAIEYALGHAAAEIAIEQLQSIVDMVAEDDDVSGIRLSTPVAALDAALGLSGWQNASTADMPSVGTGRAVILVVTVDDACLQAMARILGTRAHIARVEDPLSLLDAAPADLGQRLVVVVDCKQPSVQPSTMAVLAPELPEGARVVLWGADARTEAELHQLGDRTANWVRCSAQAEPSDVASMCAMLLG